MTGKNLNLLQRTVIVSCPSNVETPAREAALYTGQSRVPITPSEVHSDRCLVGVTIAEYYRDQGHHVTLAVDSTSRWMEALKDVYDNHAFASWYSDGPPAFLVRPTSNPLDLRVASVFIWLGS